MAGLSRAIWDEANIPTHLGLAPWGLPRYSRVRIRRADLQRRLCSQATCCGSLLLVFTQSQLYPTIYDFVVNGSQASLIHPQNIGLSKAGSAWLSHGWSSFQGRVGVQLILLKLTFHTLLGFHANDLEENRSWYRVKLQVSGKLLYLSLSLP